MRLQSQFLVFQGCLRLLRVLARIKLGGDLVPRAIFEQREGECLPRLACNTQQISRVTQALLVETRDHFQSYLRRWPQTAQLLAFLLKCLRQHLPL